MSAYGERVLMQSLFDPDNLDVLAREGISLEIVPTQDFHSIITFALRYFHDSGRRKAPTLAVLEVTELGDGVSMRSVLEDHEIPVDEEPEETVEWALEDLKATFVHKTSMTFTKSFAVAMAEAETSNRESVMSEFATRLVKASMSLESKSVRIEVREGIEDRLRAYEDREANRGTHQGMAFGIPKIDSHTYGVHPGELAIVAAFAKVGKSFFVDFVALKEYEAGRNVALFTLENSIDMTLDRLACMHLHIDSDKWQRGECNEGDTKRVREWIEKMKAKDNAIQVIQPEPGKVTAEHIVRQTQILGCDSLIIDQLSHMEHSDPNARRPKHETMSEILYSLKQQISTGRDRVSCLLAHQIKRDGKTEADKIGYHKMEHLAETSGTERVPDHVFSVYQKRDGLVTNEALFQVLAARRYPINNWQMDWDLGTAGHCKALYETTLGKSDAVAD